MGERDPLLVLDDWHGRPLHMSVDGGTLAGADGLTLRALALEIANATDVDSVTAAVAAVCPNEYRVELIDWADHTDAPSLVVTVALYVLHDVDADEPGEPHIVYGG